jgi:hypothetical protein
MTGYGLGDAYYRAHPEESIIQSIGPIARAIDRMSLQDMAWLMILLAKRETPQYKAMEGVIRSFE